MRSTLARTLPVEVKVAKPLPTGVVPLTLPKSV
jgi:hypothetical protein